MNLVYVTTEDIALGVLRSQVILPLKGLQNKNKVFLIAFKKSPSQVEKDDLFLQGIDNRVFIKEKNVFKKLIERIKFIIYLTFFLANKKPEIVHCRGLIPTVLSIIIKYATLSKAKIIYDMRSSIVDEFIEIRGFKRKAPLIKALKKIDAWAIKKADSIYCVSSTLREYVEQKRRNAPINVIPCCVDKEHFFTSYDNRSIMRKQLDLSSRLVFVYVGSFITWQMPIEIFKLFDYIKKAEPNAFLLIISNNKKEFVRIAEGFNLQNDDYKILSVDHSEVGQFTSIGDFGIMLRENIKTNYYAFPVKFGEYLASGVPVITTEGVYDIAKIIKQNKNLGYILSIGKYSDMKLIQFIAKVRRYRSVYFNKCQEYCDKNLVWDTYKSKVENDYKELVSNN